MLSPELAIDDSSDECVELKVALPLGRVGVQRGFGVGLAAGSARELCLEASFPCVVLGELFWCWVCVGFGGVEDFAGAIDGSLESLSVKQFVAGLGCFVEVSRVLDFVGLLFAFFDAFAARVAEAFFTEDDSFFDDCSVDFVDNYVGINFGHKVIFFMELLLIVDTIRAFHKLCAGESERIWGLFTDNIGITY